MSDAKTTEAHLLDCFDAGEGVLDYFDLEHGEHPNLEARRVNVDVPA